MSDSNQDIKDRLSERVRDNAQHLLDHHRKVNDQPVPAQQPLLFTGGVMRSYQIEGIEWLRVGTCRGGLFFQLVRKTFLIGFVRASPTLGENGICLLYCFPHWLRLAYQVPW